MRSDLLLEKGERRALWKAVVGEVERYLDGVGDLPVATRLEPPEVRRRLASFDFERPVRPVEAVERVVEAMRGGQVHVAHPSYFGLFNPAPATMGVVADLLVAAFNPQLATWNHAALAVETERLLVRAFGVRFGLPSNSIDGTFTSGGAEANHTALLTALTRTFPEYPRHGVRALRQQPVLYVSGLGHDSVRKAARLCGLGTDAVREVGMSETLRMSPELLAAQIRVDREHGYTPFMIVATAGATTSGVVDRVAEIADVALEEDLWLHVDAAWGGAAILVPELAGVLAGIGRADSITFDAHKFLSVPMGAGMYLTRHQAILRRTFGVAAGYMPGDSGGEDRFEPWVSTIQWSRRFIGLKLFLTLAVGGWKGYEEVIRHQTAMGDRLRRSLADGGWRVVNDTPLPLVCFVDGRVSGGSEQGYLKRVAAAVVDSGKAWISPVSLGPMGSALRACICSYRTTEREVDGLVQQLAEARRSCAG